MQSSKELQLLTILSLKENIENKEQIQHIILPAIITTELSTVSSKLQAFFRLFLILLVQIQTYIWKFQEDYKYEKSHQNKFHFRLIRNNFGGFAQLFNFMLFFFLLLFFTVPSRIAKFPLNIPPKNVYIQKCFLFQTYISDSLRRFLCFKNILTIFFQYFYSIIKYYEAMT